MTDTVTRLMGLVDAFAGSYAVHGSIPASMDIRQALEAELTRLFTPLSDEQMDAICIEAGNQLRAYCIGGRVEEPQTVGQLVEKAHGIGGES